MREWIVTNGLGSYASLTYSNTNTRKFHGLLIASIKPPTDRWVFITNIYDKVQTKNGTYYLNNIKCNLTFDIFPTFHYDINGIKIKKTIFMPYQSNTTIIKYVFEIGESISILHEPIINSRHFYDLTKQNSVNFKQIKNKCIKIYPNNINKTISIYLNNYKYKEDGYWIKYYYKKDRERNDSFLDNNYHIGQFNKEITNSCADYIILSVEDKIENIDPEVIYANELKRKTKIFKNSNLPIKFKKLIISSDNFIVKKENSKSIIAGYHWFSDWSRDALISLPGITLVTKRFDEAKKILINLNKYCKNGLIPNLFTDREAKAVYNTVDSPLWFIDRIYQYLKYTDDIEVLHRTWETLSSIISNYQNGTNYEIHMDNDFLISHGPGLTWMDVKIGNYYPTPRSKKAVEIQALWYNALKIMGILSRITGKEDYYSHIAEKVKLNFNRIFNKQYDEIDSKDISIRPNQIFLCSLDFVMIDRDLQKTITNDVHNKLVTIFGLRSLSHDDHSYKGKYIGEYNKDIAYHNGNVWPWLMGQFIKAFIRVNNKKDRYRKYAYENFLKPMLDVFGNNWDGSINEIFDGDNPYTPRGCISQAWSVGEILRSWVEDIENISPKYENKYILHKISI